MMMCAVLLVFLLGFCALCSLIRARWVRRVYHIDAIEKALREKNQKWRDEAGHGGAKHCITTRGDARQGKFEVHGWAGLAKR